MIGTRGLNRDDSWFRTSPRSCWCFKTFLIFIIRTIAACKVKNLMNIHWKLHIWSFLEMHNNTLLMISFRCIIINGAPKHTQREGVVKPSNKYMSTVHYLVHAKKRGGVQIVWENALNNQWTVPVAYVHTNKFRC